MKFNATTSASSCPVLRKSARTKSPGINPSGGSANMGDCIGAENFPVPSFSSVVISIGSVGSD